MRRPTKHRQQATVEQLESLLLLSPLQGGTPNYFGTSNPSEVNWAQSPQPTYNVTVGNPLTAGNYASDFQGTSVLAIDTQHPLPTGTLTDFQIFDQPGSGPNFFHAYVMRPTTVPGSYNVVFDSGAQLMPSASMGQVLDFPLPAPVSVQQGDLIAHYGLGIPTTVPGDQLVGTADTSVQGPLPQANTTITVPDPTYQLFSRTRTYAIDAVVTPTATAGNPLTTRGYATDGVPNVLVLDTHSPLPAGALTAFETFVDPNSGPKVFHAYVMHPTGTAGQYTVAYDSGPLSVPSLTTGQVVSFPVGPVTVQAGDVIAHYGQGVPTDVGGGADTTIVANAVPQANQTITVGDATYPVYSLDRTYSIAANVATGGIQKFVDALPGLGAANANTLGQYLPVGVSDTTAYPGSDYYEIALVQYTEKLSSSLQPTTMQGYVQVVTPTTNTAGHNPTPLFYLDGTTPIRNSAGQQVVALDPPSYLGPEIVATGGTTAADHAVPVRIKFTNYLPTGAGGDLFLPTDPTGMGAGAGPNMAMGTDITSVTIPDPLHAPTHAMVTLAMPLWDATLTSQQIIGRKVILSDLSPSVYNGEYRVAGVSADHMSFAIELKSAPSVLSAKIASGGVVQSMVAEAYTDNRATLHLHGGLTPWISDGTPNQWTSPAGESTAYPKGVSVTNVPDMTEPGDGSLTFFYSNQQSARLMFYHDHALGITRLTVYSGEAAGYLLTDQVEQQLITAGIIPQGWSKDPVADPALLGTPLIIQDKTFVDPKTVLKTDPTWNIAVNQSHNDLWTPHVWMPNQNPNDPTGGNALGHWDYGPWFWPPWPVNRDPIDGVGNMTITNPGSGYTLPPTVTITPYGDSTGGGASVSATFSQGSSGVTGFTVTNGGTGYTVPPIVTIFRAAGDSTARGATATATLGTPDATGHAAVIGITVVNLGTGYTVPPIVKITRGPGDTSGTGATATATIGLYGPVTGFTGLVGGTLYTLPPTVTITPGTGDTTGKGAAASATIDPVTGAVTGITLLTPGTGYTALPTVTITPVSVDPVTATATAVATIDGSGAVVGIEVMSKGSGYLHAPTVTLSQPPAGGTQATATAPSWVFPNVPDLSQTMESFQDTPLVNGTLYPYLDVQPQAYRFRILNAADDRMWNLQLYTTTSGIVSSIQVDPLNPGKYDPALPPQVFITPAAADAATAMGATAEAIVDPLSGAITAINMLTVGSGYTQPPTITFSPPPAGGVAAKATATVYTGDTEVGMVPALPGAAQFPASWLARNTTSSTGEYEVLNGRTGGIPDPRNIGPSMIQIGNEGGFLPAPVVLENVPAGFESNPKNIVVTNIKEKTLLLGPAERADVIIDFSQFAGKTIVLYNDAPAAVPAPDVRLDYFTANTDQTAGGGNIPTLPGYGPNTRTVMVFHVSANGTVTPFDLGKLQAAFTTTRDPVTGNVTHTSVFVQDQDPVIVPQDGYNSAYGVSNFPSSSATGAYSTIYDTSITFNPLAPGMPLGTLAPSPVTIGFQPKSIAEEFMSDYGRMSAFLGTELPFTNGGNQTTLWFSYQDPASEHLTNTTNPKMTQIGTLDDGTQIWKISHNGVDTHPVHFHLVNVQVLNRVGWDGQVVPPDPNELGWKETVRMNPLQDVIVAMRPVAPALPWNIPNSFHLIDPTMPQNSTGQFQNIDPTTGNAYTTGQFAPNVTNQYYNFGWEYVWHCHILSHEEMNMMRAITFDVASEEPAAPLMAGLTLGTNQVTLHWIDPTPLVDPVTGLPGADALGRPTLGNPANEIGFYVERAPLDAYGVPGAYTRIGTALANATSFTDTGLVAPIVAGQAYSYRVGAYNAFGADYDYTNGNITYTASYSAPADLVYPVSVTTDTGTGAYTVGKVITIIVGLNNPVTVTGGVPSLALNTPAAAVYDPNKSNLALGQLGFTYTVAAGDNIARLDYLDAASLLPGGAQIQTLAGNPAVLTLPPPASLADGLYNANIMIDTTAPTIGYTVAPTGPDGANLWYITAPTVTFTATDPASPPPSGSGIKSVTPPVLLGSGANQLVTGTAVDKAGNTASIATTINVDLVTPSATLTFSGTAGNNPWYVAYGNVTLNVTAGPSGATTTYTVDGAAQGTYSAPFPLSTDGTHTIAWTVTSGAGLSSTGSTTVQIDTVKPETTATLTGTQGLNGWYTSSVTVGLSPNDFGGSGVATNGTSYKIDTGATQTYTGPFTVSGNATHTVTYFSTDVAGNVEATKTAQIKIDTAGPTVVFGTPSPAANANGWNNSTVTIGWTASAASGINGAATGTLTFNTEGQNQTQQVTVTSMAGASQTSTSTPAVSIDLTKPVTGAAVTSGTLGNNNWYTTSTVTVTLSPNDNLSGVATTSYSINGGALSTGTTVVVSTQGVNTVTYYSTDKAGNVELTKSLNIQIDSVAPTLSNIAGTTTGPTDSTGATYNYTPATASDGTNGSGLNGSVAYNPTGFHFVVGTTTVTYSISDMAGNTTTKTFTVVVNPAGFVGNVLYVVGTSAPEAFGINATNPALTAVTINGVPVTGSTFNVTGKTIAAFGNDGNDTFTLSGAVQTTLDGGAGTNTYTVSGYTGTGSIIGSGADSVVASKNAATVTLSDTTGLSMTGGPVMTLSGVSAATLTTTGTVANTFNLTGWTGDATLNAGGQPANQVDTLVYQRDANFTLANGTLAITPVSGTARLWSLTGFESANLAGGGSDNTFDVSGWTGTGTLTGGGGTDTIAATKNIDMTLSNTAFTSGAMNLTLAGTFTRSALTANNTASRVVDASLFTGQSTLIASGTGRVKLLGGSGNDTLRVTGNGPAVLVGNGGDDILSAQGTGQTLLIGGQGADTLSSTNTGQAMMIGGATSYDANLAALDAILNEWASGRTYNQRITNILNGTGPILAPGGVTLYKLNGNVIDDLAADALTDLAVTGTAQLNWFITNNLDTVTKRSTTPPETTTNNP